MMVYCSQHWHTLLKYYQLTNYGRYAQFENHQRCSSGRLPIQHLKVALCITDILCHCDQGNDQSSQF